MRHPPVSYFVKKMAGLSKGGSKPGQVVEGSITMKQVREIAAIKKKEPRLEFITIDSISKSIVGTCRSMGVKVTEDFRGGNSGVSETPAE